VLNKLSVKHRLILGILAILCAFTGVLLPHFLKLYGDYRFFSSEYRGLFRSEKILDIVSSLLTGKKERIQKLVRALDTSDPSWEVAEEYLQEYLAEEKGSRDELVNVISQLFKVEEAILENSGALAEPDRSAINLLLAHCQPFKTIVFYFVENGFISPYITSEYLKYLRYAVKFNPELKKLFPNLSRLASFDVTIEDVLSTESLSLNYLKTLALKRKNSCLLTLIISLIIVGFTLSFILFIASSLVSSINKNLWNLQKISSALKNGEYQKIHEVSFSLRECHEECLITMKEMIDTLKLQENQIKRIQEYLRKMMLGENEGLNLEKETKGPLKELFRDLNDLNNFLLVLKNKFRLVVHALKALPSGAKFDADGLESEWKTIGMSLKHQLESLSSFLKSLNKELELLKRGEIKKLTLSKEGFSLKEALTPLIELQEDVEEVLERVKSRDFSRLFLKERSDEGNFREIRKNINEMLYSLKTEIERLKERLQQEEELNLFKATIERDSDLSTVWERIRLLLTRKFRLKRLVCLEVDVESNEIKPRISVPEGAFFCDPEILKNPELCRCKKLGKIVMGEEDRWGKVCPMFRGPYPKYVCIPFFFEEGVKCILQVLCEDEKEINLVKKKLAEISRFLERATPIIHTKQHLKTF